MAGSMDLAPGTLFATEYEVQRELSASRMGRVYVVLQRSDRQAACR